MMQVQRHIRCCIPMCQNQLKEAILTYIVLDVVFDEKDNRKKEEEVNEVESNPIEDIRTKEFSVDVLNEQTFKHEKYKIIVRK